MAEFKKLPTQAELQQMLYAGQLQGKSTQDIINENLARGTTIKALPESFFTTAGAGARQAAQFVNKAGTAQDLAKLFPGYTGQTTVPIPTSFNFAPKMDPYSGQVTPSGLQTQQIPYGDILKAIKPADVLGLTGTQQAYSDIGAGKAPSPMDVLDVVGLGAATVKPAQLGFKAGKGLLETTKGLPVGMSIQDVSNAGLLATAPKSDIGFYSAVEQAAMASPRKSAPGQAFLNDIMKGQDVRADEIKWMGLDDYLKDKKNITKQEVQDYIANNRVDVQEVKSTIPRLPGEEMPGDKGAFLPKFAAYQLPGGENYRELLLTMPSKNMGELNAAQIQAGSLRKQTTDLMSDWKRISEQSPGSPEALAAYEKVAESRRAMNQAESAVDEMKKGMKEGTYSSSHFDQPNILAHLRVNDRVDADGKKMLLIEEVQSDWHQAGRDKGYGKQPQYVKGMEGKEEGFLGMKEGVPDAPFKDTWYQLALKRAIQHAAENGYDRIGLTTGSRQAERFDLSKQLSGVSYKDGRLQGYDKNGALVMNKSVEPNELPNYVGKDLGSKLAEAAKNDQETRVMLRQAIKNDLPEERIDELRNKLNNIKTDFSGLDLQVGGEGMKKYYDEIYPKFLDKYGKKWGAKIGQTSVETDKNAKSWAYFRDWFAQNHSDVGSSSTALSYWENGEKNKYVREFLKDIKTQEPIRYLDITPQMKAGVSKGQPLFQAAPIAAGGGLLGSQQDQRK